MPRDDGYKYRRYRCPWCFGTKEPRRIPGVATGDYCYECDGNGTVSWHKLGPVERKAAREEYENE